MKSCRRLAEAEEELARVRSEAEDVRQNRSNVEREVVEAQDRVRQLEEASQGQEGLVLELRSYWQGQGQGCPKPNLGSVKLFCFAIISPDWELFAVGLDSFGFFF